MGDLWQRPSQSMSGTALKHRNTSVWMYSDWILGKHRMTSGVSFFSETGCLSSCSSSTTGLLPVAIQFSAFISLQRTSSLSPSLFPRTSPLLGPYLHRSVRHWSVASTSQDLRLPYTLSYSKRHAT